MENFIINKTKHIPLIVLDYKNSNLLIKGESYPENALAVYKPLLEKLDEYFVNEKKSLFIDIYVDYLNTSSSKMMSDMIMKLQNFFEEGHKIELKWYYPLDDEDCKEACELFLEDVNFQYQIIEQDY